MYSIQRNNFILRAWKDSDGPEKYKSLYSAVNSGRLYQLENAEK